MKYACPNCGAVEELIAAKNPDCLSCRVAMIQAETYEGLWINPDFVLSRMGRVIETYGRDRVASGRFKHEREAYASALWALALCERSGIMHWIEVETLDQTPDTKVHYLTQDHDGNHDWVYNVEVVDWTEHSDDPMEVIEPKCKKAYPSYFVLLVFARHGEKMFSPDVLAEQISRIRNPFFEIWIVGPKTDQVAISVRLHPLPVVFFECEVVRMRQAVRAFPAFIKKQQRGRGTEFEDLGQCFLPIP